MQKNQNTNKQEFKYRELQFGGGIRNYRPPHQKYQCYKSNMLNTRTLNIKKIAQYGYYNEMTTTLKIYYYK